MNRDKKNHVHLGLEVLEGREMPHHLSLLPLVVVPDAAAAAAELHGHSDNHSGGRFIFTFEDRYGRVFD